MERKLLLLGLLRSHPMYGYQINEMIDAHLGTSVQVTKPTAYRLLTQMAENGWVEFQEEREGNRPTRRVYTMTPEGECAFQRLLRESLAEPDTLIFSGGMGFLFLDEVPPDEALPLLEKRRDHVVQALQKAQSHDGHQMDAYSWVFSRQIQHLEVELVWLDEVIAYLEAKTDKPPHRRDK